MLRFESDRFRPANRVPPRRGSRLGDAASDTIETAVFEIANSLDTLAKRLGSDLDLAIDPVRHTEVPAMGELTRGQALEAIARISEHLEITAKAIADPPLGPYLTPEAIQLLQAAIGRLGTIPQVARARGAEALPPNQASVVDVYEETYFSELLSKIIDAERFIVGVEQGAVDLREPAEKERENAIRVLVGVGIVAVVGAGIYFFSENAA